KIDSHIPANVPSLTGVKAIAAGGYHSLALRTAGDIKAWGLNYDGQLGDGTTTESSSPTDVLVLTSGVSTIAAGGYHSLALTESGAAKSWGFNSNGQLGDGTTTRRTTPGDVSGLSSGINAIAAGETHSLALPNSGNLKAWGYNNSGQLGNNSVTDALSPVNVEPLE
ncbi:MAG TPA: hypothetical protein VKO67_07750, partial [Smithellaceae bacterium]|nr:hypothetical protein [Smithellaceae bacterium]